MSLFDELNSLNDLNDLIERKIRESDILEYKTASDQIQPNEKDAASKALSAFANTSGGVLIYGMATRDPKDPERPTAIESISARTASHLLKHAEEGVRHPIPGVRKKPIAAEDDRQVLLFDVPPSPIARISWRATKSTIAGRTLIASLCPTTLSNSTLVGDCIQGFNPSSNPARNRIRTPIDA